MAPANDPAAAPALIGLPTALEYRRLLRPVVAVHVCGGDPGHVGTVAGEKLGWGFLQGDRQ